jgi:hypothetical protein
LVIIDKGNLVFFAVTLSWCNNGVGYYTAEMLISHAQPTEDLQEIVELCLKMLEIKKVTSARIDMKGRKIVLFNTNFDFFYVKTLIDIKQTDLYLS